MKRGVCLLLMGMLALGGWGCGSKEAAELKEGSDSFDWRPEPEDASSNDSDGFRPGDRARGRMPEGNREEVEHGSGMGRRGMGRRGDRVGRPDDRLPPRWRTMDANEDGHLERTEFTGVEEEFQRLDANADGKLWPKETWAGKPLHTTMAEFFQYLDGDADGEVTEPEWAATFDALNVNTDANLSPEELRTASDKPLAGVLLGYFGHFDREPKSDQQPGRDGDLQISRDEWNSEFHELDRVDPNDRLLREEIAASVQLQRFLGEGVRSRAAGAFPARFTQMDGNADKEISRDEFQGGEEEFARLDADADGQLVPPEVRHSVPTALVIIYRMKAIDADADGAIDNPEWKQAFARLAPGATDPLTREGLRPLLADAQDANAAALAKLVLEHFSDFDADRKGSISDQEWQARFEVFDFTEPKGRLTPEKLRAAVGRQQMLRVERPAGETAQ